MRNKEVKSQKSKVKSLEGVIVVWLIVGVVVILVITIIAFKLGVVTPPVVPQIPGISKDQQIEDLKKVDTSDKVDDIKKDLDATNLDNLDKELGDIKKDIEGL